MVLLRVALMTKGGDVMLMRVSRKESTYMSISKIVSQTHLIIALIQQSISCYDKNPRVGLFPGKSDSEVQESWL